MNNLIEKFANEISDCNQINNNNKDLDKYSVESKLNNCYSKAFSSHVTDLNSFINTNFDVLTKKENYMEIIKLKHPL